MVTKACESPRWRIHSHRFSRKGYFFVIDATVAITIVLLGIFLLFSSGASSFSQEQPLTSLEDFVTLSGARSLAESTNNYYTGTLLPARVVPLPDMTPLEEVGYLLFRYNETGNVTYLHYASNFTASLFNDSIEARYGASLTVNGTLVYRRAAEPSSFNIGRTTVLYVRMNETAIKGPVLSEVQLWY